MPQIVWVLVVVLLIFALVGAPGLGPWNHQWGWYPSGGAGLILVILLVVLLLR